MIDGIRAALVSLEQRMDRRFDAVEQRVAATDQQTARQFIWVVGVQVSTFAALALLAR